MLNIKMVFVNVKIFCNFANNKLAEFVEIIDKAVNNVWK